MYFKSNFKAIKNYNKTEVYKILSFEERYLKLAILVSTQKSL